METSYYESPIGILEIICKDETLISLKFVENIKKTNYRTIFIDKIQTQLKEYFSGSRKEFKH